MGELLGQKLWQVIRLCLQTLFPHAILCKHDIQCRSLLPFGRQFNTISNLDQGMTRPARIVQTLQQPNRLGNGREAARASSASAVCPQPRTDTAPNLRVWTSSLCWVVFVCVAMVTTSGVEVDELSQNFSDDRLK